MTILRRLLAVTCLAALTAFALPAFALPASDPLEAAFESIVEADLLADLQVLASPALEGRDSPSTGLTRAAEHVAARLAAMGYAPPGDEQDASMLVPFVRSLPTPDAARCALASPQNTSWVLGSDFVPVPDASGSAQGEVVFVGFGIDDAGERYDDVPGDLFGKVALILDGEPRHKKKFDGPEVTAAADLYSKLEELRETDAVGVLVVRRPPPAADDGSKSSRSSSRSSRSRKAAEEPPAAPALEAEFGFRHTWASWAGERPRRGGRGARGGRGGDGGRGGASSRGVLPALEITPAVASALIGEDVLALAAGIDAKAKPPRPLHTGVEVTLASYTTSAELPIENVVGVLAGSDPELAGEYVVLGAHLDHVGVDPRGRIGFGADDNASGVAALLEVAQALAAARPRRSVVACAFGGEEDDLLGSRAFCTEWPVPKDAIAAMLNLDMVGRGEVAEVAVLGIPENPGLEKLLDRAKDLHKTRIRKITVKQGQHLFRRSDHYPFHQAGIPALFFFEGLPETDNEDYHTWRDTLDKLDLDKIARTARLVFNTAWLLCDADERPDTPRRD